MGLCYSLRPRLFGDLSGSISNAASDCEAPPDAAAPLRSGGLSATESKAEHSLTRSTVGGIEGSCCSQDRSGTGVPAAAIFSTRLHRMWVIEFRDGSQSRQRRSAPRRHTGVRPLLA
ncbi:guanine nucleotide-binding protein G(olf) subunit alpha isoform X1 [Arapaima gigas]